jgi:hypothetical protein
MEDRIMTQHPQKKSGVNIQRDKYEQVRSAIELVLRTNGPQSFQALNNAVGQELAGNFDGSIGWYFTTVKLDLEARGEIICERKSGQPQMIHWAEN